MQPNARSALPAGHGGGEGERGSALGTSVLGWAFPALSSQPDWGHLGCLLGNILVTGMGRKPADS